MNIVASATGKGVKIDALALETRVLGNVSPVTAVTRGKLLFPVIHRVRIDMAHMAACTINVFPVVRATKEFDHTGAADRFPVAGQARIDLLLSWRNAFTTAKTRQWRKTASTVRPRNMDTARAVTGLTVPGNCGRAQDFRLAVHTGLNRMHLWPRVAQQASFSPLSGIAGHAFSFLYAVRILRKNNSA